MRLAFVVSHPIQYYAPLYQYLARQPGLAIKVFFTWHGANHPVADAGFGIAIAWDIALTSGYEHEVVPNVAHEPGTHRFFGLRNPELVRRVKAWSPDWVHITGWAWWSHLIALCQLHRSGTRTLFRGDSHLLDERRKGLRWWLKRLVLSRIFAWPTAFLVVGKANRRYYEAFDVPAERLFDCPHSIDRQRFNGGDENYEHEALLWRRSLGLRDDQIVLLYAGKVERRKGILDLMRAVGRSGNGGLVLIIAGSGELSGDVHRLAGDNPSRFRLLPFQNQSVMPIVYRLGDVSVLPSRYGETWGLAVNEALASGRPVLVSDRVGCAEDVVDQSCGWVFPTNNPAALEAALDQVTMDIDQLRSMRAAARDRSMAFDIPRTAEALLAAIRHHA